MTFETVATDPADTAVILYGSGMSGRPAIGAELTHMNLLLNAMMTDSMFVRAAQGTYLMALPLFHTFGQSVCMNMGFLRRVTLVLLPRFEAEGPGPGEIAIRGHNVMKGYHNRPDETAQVNLAVVVGVPHERYGEEIKVYVVRATGAAISARDLVTWCSHAMPTDKYPRVIEFRERLPMTATGKILKRELG